MVLSILEEKNAMVGSVACAFAILAYGSAFAPVKKFNSKDGVFASWVMSVGAMPSFFLCSLAYGSPIIHPIAILSGILCALGSSLMVFVLNNLGMGVGSLLWNVSACVVGWALPRFGLLGYDVTEPGNNLLNVLGVIVIIIGACACSLVGLFSHSTAGLSALVADKAMDIEMNGGVYVNEKIPEECRSIAKNNTSSDKKMTFRKKIWSILTAMLIGASYANMPTILNILVQDAKHGVESIPAGLPLSIHMAAYILSFGFGSMMGQSAIFGFYALYKSNRPFVNAQLIAPGLLSGIIFGAGLCGDVIAYEHLDQIIAFPLTTVCPSIIASLWSILVFKEIKGCRNMAVFAAAVFITSVGVLLISVSK